VFFNIILIDIDVKSEGENPNRMQVITEDGGVKLDCDLSVTGNPKPSMFFWVREGAEQSKGTDHRLNLTPKTAGTKETVMCTAGNSIGLSFKLCITDKTTNNY